MVAAGVILCLYPKLFRVICTAHLLHNCAMKVKSHFEDVDQLISKIKSATKKANQTKKIRLYWSPTYLVVTRWVSRLNAAKNYVKKLPDVKQLMESLRAWYLRNSSKS